MKQRARPEDMRYLTNDAIQIKLIDFNINWKINV